jgi:hypothetical protein
MEQNTSSLVPHCRKINIVRSVLTVILMMPIHYIFCFIWFYCNLLNFHRMYAISSPNLPDVDTQLYNICLSYIYNIIQELVELTMFTFK